jgi:hypothetical protein
MLNNTQSGLDGRTKSLNICHSQNDKMKYTRTLCGLAVLLGLIVVVGTNIPESTYAQMNMSAPSAGGGVPKSTSGNITTAPTKTDTFSANGIISSLVFVTQNPNNTIRSGW